MTPADTPSDHDDNPFAPPLARSEARPEASIAGGDPLFRVELGSLAILQVAWRVFRARTAAFLLLAIGSSLLVNPLAAYGSVLVDRGEMVGLAIAMGSSLLGLPALIGIVRITEGVMQGRDESWAEALGAGLVRWPATTLNIVL